MALTGSMLIPLAQPILPFFHGKPIKHASHPAIVNTKPAGFSLYHSTQPVLCALVAQPVIDHRVYIMMLIHQSQDIKSKPAQ
jgi:hypothetical protein